MFLMGVDFVIFSTIPRFVDFILLFLSSLQKVFQTCDRSHTLYLIFIISSNTLYNVNMNSLFFVSRRKIS
jgi:hypothetical protein